MDLSGLTMLFQDKLMNYQELIDVLKEERNRIISAEVDHLWQIADRKQQIVSRVEALRADILQILTTAGIFHEMTVATFQASRVLALVPVDVRKELFNRHNALVMARKEIQARTRENVAYVEESLASLNGLIGLFAQSGNDGMVYNRHRHTDTTRTRTLLHQQA